MPKESTLRSMAVCLFLVCLACSALLGGVYVLTLDKINQEVVKKTNNAIALVTPEFDNEPSAESLSVELDGDAITVYPARKGGASAARSTSWSDSTWTATSPVPQSFPTPRLPVWAPR